MKALIISLLNENSFYTYKDLFEDYLKGGTFYYNRDELRQRLGATEEIFKTFGITEDQLTELRNNIRDDYHANQAKK